MRVYNDNDGMYWVSDGNRAVYLGEEITTLISGTDTAMSSGWDFDRAKDCYGLEPVVTNPVSPEAFAAQKLREQASKLRGFARVFEMSDQPYSKGNHRALMHSADLLDEEAGRLER